MEDKTGARGGRTGQRQQQRHCACDTTGAGWDADTQEAHVPGMQCTRYSQTEEVTVQQQREADAEWGQIQNWGLEVRVLVEVAEWAAGNWLALIGVDKASSTTPPE